MTQKSKQSFTVWLKRTDIVKTAAVTCCFCPLCFSIFIFAYFPMVGVIIAFEDFDPIAGMFASPWTGWKTSAFSFPVPPGSR